MIEFPESRTLARQIKEQMLGKTATDVQTNSSPHKFAWFHGDPAAYRDRLTGKTVTDTNAYGGMAETVLEGADDTARLVLFDGVNIQYFASGEKIPDKHQLRVEFDDNSSLVCTVQMYGGILLTGADDGENGHYLSSKTKISPLSEENTEEYFFGLMDGIKQNYSVKAFLATEQRFPGLGNGMLQDILFNAEIHPRRRLETLSRREKEAIYNSVRQTLCEMTEGSGRDTEKDLYGRSGGYRTKLSAKTKDSPSTVCGDIIMREAFMGGNVYFCPTCQRYEKE